MTEERLWLAEERLEVGKREVERGRVVVRTRVEERPGLAELDLQQEEVSVERVAIGRPVEAMPPVREEDGVLVVPVVEEELVVTKRLILKEEIRIVRRTRTETVRETVPLRFEQVEIVREDRSATQSPTLGQSETPGQSQILGKGEPSMTDRTITAMYDTRGAAESARDELIGLGVDRSDISIRSGNGDAEAAPDATEGRGFWASLTDLFMPDEDVETYTEGLNRGGYLLSAKMPSALADEAADVLERYEPIDLDQRSERWRREGWTGSEAGTRTTAPAADVISDADLPTAPLAYDTASTRKADNLTATGDEDVVQAVEEELQVGKKEVGRGKLRVRTYVTERPVEEQVELRQEQVSVDRRPVDRAVAPGEAVFQERTIEAVERGEEPVISKSARVTEEVGLHKDVNRETRTVRDTLRKQDIEVEDERSDASETTRGTRPLDDTTPERQPS
jgi:uncharacterized protein (TIGR02271 family)